MEENRKKQAYLMQYGYAMKRMVAAEYEYMEYAYSLLGKGITYDAMPHGSGPTGDLAEVMVKKLELEENMLREIEELGKVRRIIHRKIETLPTEAEKLVMTIRYTNLERVTDGAGRVAGYRWKPWDKVAEGCCYSLRHATKLHGIALSHLHITQEEYDEVGVRKEKMG